MDERFERNIGAITALEQESLFSKKAVIIGCGGLGCHSAELLARIGIGHLTLIDGDVFAASNMNRQLNSMKKNLGKNKAAEAKKRLAGIRSDLSVKAVKTFLNTGNARKLLKSHDLIIDALDNVRARLLIEETANKLGIPIIHGAVEGWCAQVCTVFPGDFTLSMLYREKHEFDKPSVLSFAPAFCASIQASEAVKVLLGRTNILRKKLFTASLRDNTFNIIELCSE